MMRFLARTAALKLLGALPGGEAAYAWAQRHIVRSVAPTEETLLHKRLVALEIVALLRAHGVAPAGIGPHLDIGAGWMPVVPLVLRQHGMARQVLIDVRRAMTDDAVRATAAFLDARRGDGAALGVPAAGEDVRDWLARHDIRYLAPAHPPFDLPDGAFGLATATQVFNYPAADVVRRLHEEAARLLRPGGLYLASLRLCDQSAGSDPALPRFHFLRYESARWRRWFDNPITPQNRLRPSQHRRLLDGLPFETLLWRVEGGGPEDLAELARSRPHPEFAALAPADLAATGLTFLLRRL